ncbi:MAG: type II toxin-antitoxin system prevent-host-death family antitoxin [Pyrinomonadaceae bacterium]
MYQIEIDKAKAQIADLFKTALEGEEVVITQNDQPVLKLVPIAHSKPRPQFGSAKGLITMSDDFDEPLEDFEEYMR